MRYLLDTNTFVFMALDPDSLSNDVLMALNEPDSLLYISAESVKELIVAYKKKRLGTKKWKTAEEMVKAIEEVYYVEILPLKKEHMETLSRLRVNEAMAHNDPSDHVIISHAMTENMVLVSSDTRFPFYRRQGLKLLYNER
jgi:PIN domain nuclease of toxin-antitoxin system